MHEELNQIQSDVNLYEDFISSSMYLQDFDEIFQPKQLGALTQNIIDDIKETNYWLKINIILTVLITIKTKQNF